ncbi:MAG: helix-turn-helix domain-containing protein [Candidatus Marinimicrobia bacterium]|nr:helix-turn-helix domain-containing protein [Candidatus Neomarinimicrobiota bacterium]
MNIVLRTYPFLPKNEYYELRKPTQTLLPQLLTTKEVADWLGISRERVYSLCATQQFPCIKISPRRVRYCSDNIKKWLKERGWNGT